MANGITITKTEYNVLIEKMERLEKAVKFLASKMEEILPVREGSDLWWERENEKAIKSIKEGKGILIKSEEELRNFLEI
ncbi:MAG: hypothetical protein WCP39_08325 [Chlamydiota bacterium]